MKYGKWASSSKKANWYKIISIIGLIGFIVFGLLSCDNQKSTNRDIAARVQAEKHQLIVDMKNIQSEIDLAYTKFEVSAKSKES